MVYQNITNHLSLYVLQPFAGLFGAAEMQWYLITKKHSFLQVIFATTHWLRTWAILVVASHFLAQVAKDFFARVHGWQSSLRIDSY